jgi:hypothetical protein
MEPLAVFTLLPSRTLWLTVLVGNARAVITSTKQRGCCKSTVRLEQWVPLELGVAGSYQSAHPIQMVPSTVNPSLLSWTTTFWYSELTRPVAMTPLASIFSHSRSHGPLQGLHPTRPSNSCSSATFFPLRFRRRNRMPLTALYMMNSTSQYAQLRIAPKSTTMRSSSHVSLPKIVFIHIMLVTSAATNIARVIFQASKGCL